MFLLRKEWQDPEDGIETVILYWATTPEGEEPRWRQASHTVMIPQPAAGRLQRSCSVSVVPPFSRQQILFGEPAGSVDHFLFHSFFEVIQRGRRWRTEAESLAMRAALVTHSDPSGECTEAVLYYSLDTLAHVNCIPMFLDGLPARSQFLPVRPEGKFSIEDYKARTRRYKQIADLPPPHLFRGKLWGPAGTQVLYTVYFSRTGELNPFSETGFWLLDDGRLWEVRL
jgi:hypothetical protein